MTKRSFREQPSTAEVRPPSYPTLEEFDATSRRSFLARLGVALAGAGGLALLGACGGRRVDARPDQGSIAGGASPLDSRLDAGPPRPDQMTIAGGAMPPDARADEEVPVPTPGEAPLPDARIDPSPGFAPLPDARADQVPQPTLGKVAPMDARIDQESCEIP